MEKNDKEFWLSLFYKENNRIYTLTQGNLTPAQFWSIVYFAKSVGIDVDIEPKVEYEEK